VAKVILQKKKRVVFGSFWLNLVLFGSIVKQNAVSGIAYGKANRLLCFDMLKKTKIYSK
jgi:hypothetical protein